MLARVHSLSLCLIVLSGCASRPTPPLREGEPIGVQMLRVEPQLKGRRFVTLLDFEDDTDAVFVAADPPRRLARAEFAHTGRSAVLVPEGTNTLTISLDALGAKPLPGPWTLAGVYLHSEQPLKLKVNYEADGRLLASTPQQVPAGQWAAAMVDLGPLAVPGIPRPTSAGRLVIQFDEPPAGPVRLDDLVLVNNEQMLLDTTGGQLGQGWMIRRAGYRFVGVAPAQFGFTLPTAEASPNGWRLEEANALRARFSSDGQVKALTVYADGRAYWDGEYKPMSGSRRPHDVVRRQHASPADLHVPETVGRIDRTTDGDANNDGYNECRGAYQLRAAGSRLEVKLVPRPAPLVLPVLEITGMPEGRMLATVEGRLISAAVRTDSGSYLLELPLRVERPMTVNVRVHEK